MAAVKSPKNMKKNGPKARKAFLEQVLKEMESTRNSLQTAINRPQQFEDALRKETDFGERYGRMSYGEKERVQTRVCNHCQKFSVHAVNINSPFGIYYRKHGGKRDAQLVHAEWNNLPDHQKAEFYRDATIILDFITVPGEMEQLASFFGMCNCMWERYVARTYRPRYLDPFDMNEYRKRDRYQKLAVDAQYKMKKLNAREKGVRKELEKITVQLAEAEIKRKEVQQAKAATMVDDDEMQRRLEKRRIQAEKNKRKMARARQITTSPHRRRRR